MRLSGKKLIVLLLYAPTESSASINVPISGRTRLMKMGFLFKEEVWPVFKKGARFEDALPKFYHWKFGPFSKELLTDLEFLINQRFIAVATSSSMALMEEELVEYEHWIEDLSDFDSNELGEEVFSLSRPKGLDKGKEIWSELNDDQKRILKKFKSSFIDASLDKILMYVYRKYEHEYTDKSIIKDRYLH